MLAHYSKRCFVVEWIKVMYTLKKIYQIIWLSRAVLNDSFGNYIILLSTYVMVSIQSAQPLGMLLPWNLDSADLIKTISVYRNSRPKAAGFARLWGIPNKCAHLKMQLHHKPFDVTSIELMHVPVQHTTSCTVNIPSFPLLVQWWSHLSLQTPAV